MLLGTIEMMMNADWADDWLSSLECLALCNMGELSASCRDKPCCLVVLCY